jgi:hypothetical protein
MYETFEIIKPFLLTHGIGLMSDDYSGGTSVLVDGNYYPAIICRYEVKKAPPISTHTDHIALVPSKNIIAGCLQALSREHFDLHKPNSLEKLAKFLVDRHKIPQI